MQKKVAARGPPPSLKPRGASAAASPTRRPRPASRFKTTQRAEERQRKILKASPAPAQQQQHLPHGLQERTLADYQLEWCRYLDFANANGKKQVPGRDVSWDMQFLWEYMQFRARTCKPTTVTQIVTKLRHFGLMHNFPLATSRFDANPGQHGVIRNMRRQLAIDARLQMGNQGKNLAEVDRCTPVGKRSVDMLLSAFKVVDERSFRLLRREHRHHLFATVLQHTGGMRFGQFTERDYSVDAFVQDSRASFRLVTDYSRYSGARQYCVEFAAFPRYESMWYHVSNTDGVRLSVFSAATLIRWHFDMLREHGQRQVFRPVVGQLCSREQRKAWLRAVLLQALPPQEHAARALVEDVTPHSFRAGLAGDLFREGITLQTIGSVCRWNSAIAIRLYAERPCLSMSRSSDKFRFIHGARD